MLKMESTSPQSKKLQEKLESIKFKKNRVKAVSFIQDVTGVKLDIESFFSLEETKEIKIKLDSKGIVIDPNQMPPISKSEFNKNLNQCINTLPTSNYFFRTYDIDSGFVRISYLEMIKILENIRDAIAQKNFTFVFFDENFSSSFYIDYYYNALTGDNLFYEFASKKA